MITAKNLPLEYRLIEPGRAEITRPGFPPFKMRADVFVQPSRLRRALLVKTGYRLPVMDWNTWLWFLHATNRTPKDHDGRPLHHLPDVPRRGTTSRGCFRI
jgi:hypothetical protein